MPTVLYPRSLGTVKLASANVFDAPLIDPNFLSDPEGHDLQVLSEVVDLARSIARSDAMAGVVDAELSPSGTAFAADGSEARSEEMLRFLCAHTTLSGRYLFQQQRVRSGETRRTRCIIQWARARWAQRRTAGRWWTLR